MNRLMVILALMFSGSAFADGCDFVEGTWRIDRFDVEQQAQVETEVIFASDGNLRADSRAEWGGETFYFEDWGTWSCENGVVELNYTKSRNGIEGGFSVMLELKEANTSYLGFREIRENGASVQDGQAIRVSESSYIHCC